MRKFIILAIAVITISAIQAEAQEKIRKGLQQNLSVYAQVLGQEKVNYLLQLIARGEVGNIVVKIGTIGDNYFVSESGRLKVIRNYQLPYDRPARVVDGVIFFTTCDNLFIPKPKETADRPLQPCPPAPPQQKIQLDHNLKVAPLKVNVTSQENINLKVEPIKADIKVEAVIKDERPPAPVNVTIINQQAAAPVGYYGPGGMQSGVTTTTYQIAGLQQQQLYPQPQPINIGPTNITATGGAGGNASATGGNATATGGNASSSASAAANSQ